MDAVQGLIRGKRYHIMAIEGARIRGVKYDNLWDVGAFGGVRRTLEVQGSGWGVGDQMIQLL